MKNKDCNLFFSNPSFKFTFDSANFVEVKDEFNKVKNYIITRIESCDMKLLNDVNNSDLELETIKQNVRHE